MNKENYISQLTDFMFKKESTTLIELFDFFEENEIDYLGNKSLQVYDNEDNPSHALLGINDEISSSLIILLANKIIKLESISMSEFGKKNLEIILKRLFNIGNQILDSFMYKQIKKTNIYTYDISLNLLYKTRPIFLNLNNDIYLTKTDHILFSPSLIVLTKEAKET